MVNGKAHECSNGRSLFETETQAQFVDLKSLKALHNAGTIPSPIHLLPHSGTNKCFHLPIISLYLSKSPSLLSNPKCKSIDFLFLQNGMP